MGWLSKFTRSSIGSKYLMGLTGIAMVLFLIAHMTGNLLVFQGPDAINAYGAGLREMGHGSVLWIARGGLVVVVLIHIFTALSLTGRNSSARPVKYKRFQTRVTGYAARTMIVTGLVLFVYIVFHLMHYTLHVGPGAGYDALVDSAGRHDVYKMVVAGFSNKGIAIFYIVSMFLLTGHLGHGIPSFFQSMGLRHPKYTPMLHKLGKTITVVLFLGFSSVPVAVMAGWVA